MVICKTGRAVEEERRAGRGAGCVLETDVQKESLKWPPAWGCIAEHFVPTNFWREPNFFPVLGKSHSDGTDAKVSPFPLWDCVLIHNESHLWEKLSLDTGPSG